MPPIVTRAQALLQQLAFQFGLSAPRCQTAVPTAATSLVVSVVIPTPLRPYGVLVTPSWLTTVAVSARTLTSVTVDFGTAAPAGATIDLLFFRA